MNNPTKQEKITRVLVTGGAGFIGANLIRKLINQNFQVHALIRPNTDTSKITDILPRLKSHEVDLKEALKLKRIVREISPEIIFHLAAADVVSNTKKASPGKVLTTNFLGTINLISAARDIDYHLFVNTGSSSEYGLKNKPMLESDICKPVNLYGITKLSSTLYGQLEALTNNKPILTLRLFTPYGPYDTQKRLIASAIISALKNRDIHLTSPKIVRDFIFVEDVLDAYLSCIEKGHQLAGEIFNIGSGRMQTIASVVDKITKITNSKSKLLWNLMPLSSLEPKIWQSDTTKSKKLLGWQPKHSLDSGLEKTVAWFIKNLN